MGFIFHYNNFAHIKNLSAVVVLPSADLEHAVEVSSGTYQTLFALKPRSQQEG